MKKFAAASLLLVSFSSSAAFMSGNDLYQIYESYKRADSRSAGDRDLLSANEYLGYVTGFADATNGSVYCPGKMVTRGQVASVVGKFLGNNPEVRDMSAQVLLFKSLSSAFPCK